MENRDLRLYTYNYGSLKRCGVGKLHLFKDIYTLKERINILKNKGNKNQFVIIEYFNSHESQIIEII